MPLTAKDWIENSTPEMLIQIRTKEEAAKVPPNLKACKADPNWWKMFRLFAHKVDFSGENVGFLDAVDKFKKQPSAASAREIYQKLVSPDAPGQINLGGEHQEGLDRWFRTPDIFETAYQEVSREEDPERDGAFRAAVNIWRQGDRRDGAEARTMYDKYIREGGVGRIQLSDETRRLLLGAFEVGPDTAVFFDEAYAGILVQLEDPYQRFQEAAREIAPHLTEALEESTAISRPGKLESPQGRPGQPTANKPDQATVNEWNKKALNVLRQGQETDFFQVGDVIIIASAAGGMPPGVVWAQQQGATTGTITMTQRAGAFDAGSMKVQGASDSEAFRKGVASVSKRRLEYA